MHMSTYCNQHIEENESSGGPTAALDVHIGELQMEFIQPIDVYLCNGLILSDSGYQGAKLKLVMRELDSLVYIQGCCRFLNDPERMNIVRRHLEVSDSNTEIKLVEDTASAEKKDEHVIKMIELERKAEFF